MPGLGCFPGADNNGLVGCQQVVGHKQGVAQGHDSWVFGNVLKNFVSGNQRVNALRAIALEIIAPAVAAQHAVVAFVDGVQLLTGQEVRNHGVALLSQGLQYVILCGDGHDLLHCYPVLRHRLHYWAVQWDVSC